MECYIHRGAGAYVCGEETGLIESLEGKRGWPRIKPPFPAVAGLFGKPTVVNNVETLACLPHIIERGASWFTSIGPQGSAGPKLFCVSGPVNRPGCYEHSMDLTVRELIEGEDFGQGMSGGRAVKGVFPGGLSMGALTAQSPRDRLVRVSQRTVRASTRSRSTVTPMPGWSRGTLTKPSESIVHSGSTMSRAQ